MYGHPLVTLQVQHSKFYNKNLMDTFYKPTGKKAGIDVALMNLVTFAVL